MLQRKNCFRIEKNVIDIINHRISDMPPETGGILGSHGNDILDEVIIDLPDLTSTEPCSYFPNVDFSNQNIAS